MICYTGRMEGRRGLGKIASWETGLGSGSIIGGYKLEGSQKIPRQASYFKILPKAIPELQKRCWTFKTFISF